MYLAAQETVSYPAQTLSFASAIENVSFFFFTCAFDHFRINALYVNAQSSLLCE